MRVVGRHPSVLSVQVKQRRPGVRILSQICDGGHVGAGVPAPLRHCTLCWGPGPKWCPTPVTCMVSCRMAWRTSRMSRHQSAHMCMMPLRRSADPRHCGLRQLSNSEPAPSRPYMGTDQYMRCVWALVLYVKPPAGTQRRGYGVQTLPYDFGEGGIRGGDRWNAPQCGTIHHVIRWTIVIRVGDNPPHHQYQRRGGGSQQEPCGIWPAAGCHGVMPSGPN